MSSSLSGAPDDPPAGDTIVAADQTVNAADPDPDLAADEEEEAGPVTRSGKRKKGKSKAPAKPRKKPATKPARKKVSGLGLDSVVDR